MPLLWHARRSPIRPTPRQPPTRAGARPLLNPPLASPAGGGFSTRLPSASPVSMPRNAAAPAAAVRARALTSSTRSGDSSTLFGAVGSAKMRFAESGVLTCFLALSRRHGISNFASLKIGDGVRGREALVWCCGATSACAAMPSKAAVLMAASFLPPGWWHWWLPW